MLELSPSLTHPSIHQEALTASPYQGWGIWGWGRKGERKGPCGGPGSQEACV